MCDKTKIDSKTTLQKCQWMSNAYLKSRTSCNKATDAEHEDIVAMKNIYFIARSIKNFEKNPEWYELS